MAGHSQFKNIMYRKGAQDKRRAKIFSRLSKEITVAAKIGMIDPAANPRLRSAIQAARVQNMPKDNIERAIRKSQDADAENYEEVRYEGFAAGGIGVIVETLTDNRNRTAGEVRSIFSKNGGNLGETGAVSFMFDRVGLVEYPLAVASADEMLEAAIEAGAEDCITGSEIHELYCRAEDLHEVSGQLEKRFGEPNSAQLLWRPQSQVPADDDTGEKVLRMIDALENNEDVQNVYANFDISEDVLERIGT